MTPPRVDTSGLILSRTNDVSRYDISPTVIVGLMSFRTKSVSDKKRFGQKAFRTKRVSDY